MGNFEEAKRFNALLLEREPSNLQAQSLAQLIEKGVTREGYIGMALTAGAAAVGGVLIASLMRRGRR
jgi:mitochondrial fission 1 protein